MTTWVDYRELREKLRFSAVLKDYGVELKVKGDRATGFCPLPGHRGQRHSPSFSANLARGIFQCFGCQAKGNVLEFACLMEGVDPGDSRAFREVALKLQEKFLGTNSRLRPARDAGATHPPPATAPPQEASEAKRKPSEVDTRPVVVNAPLDFSLQKLDAEHPYLKSRGLTAETIAHFGLGYCARGLMESRIAIPLHDSAGRLIGYAGRLVDDRLISDENPKYRFPGPREKKGIVYELHKSFFLYNGHRIPGQVRDLYVVEGFASVWWLAQAGFSNVVALMGNSCSDEQAVLIRSMVSPSGRVWILPDADEGGTRCAHSLLVHLARHRFCRWIKLGDGQPTDLTPNELVTLLQWKVVP